MQARTSNLHLSTNPFCIPSFAVRKIQASASTDKAGSKHRKLSHLVNTKCILSHEEYTPAFFCTLEGASRPTLFDKCVRRTRTRLVERTLNRRAECRGGHLRDVNRGLSESWACSGNASLERTAAAAARKAASATAGETSPATARRAVVRAGDVCAGDIVRALSG